MDVESAAVSQNSETKQKDESRSENQVNGVSNGFSGENKPHKSSHKDKHRDRDRDRDKDRDHKKDHKSSSKDKDRDRSKHSSSKDKDKERSKDHKSSRDKDRDRDKDRSDRDKSRSDKDKDRERSDKDRERSDKHKSDKDRHHDDKKSSSSSKEHKSSSHSSSRDKDKEHKSSSSHDKDKHKHSSSSKDKDRHSSSKDKDRSKSSSSSSKDKHHSSSKDKDRKDKDKERERERSEKSKSQKEVKVEKEKAEIKEEIKEDSMDSQPPINQYEEDPLDIKDEMIIDEGNENQNISTASSCDYSLSQFNKSEPDFDASQMNGECDDSNIKQEEDSNDDMPLASRASTPTKRKYEEEDDDDDLPLVARKKVKKEKKKAKKRAYDDDDEEDEYEEKPKVKKTKVKKEVKQEIKQETISPKKRKKKEEEEQQVWKWWEEEKKDDGTKWHFLEHKGPVFAPPYEPLPDNVKFYYDGKEMKLSQDAEEVAGFYARMLEHDYTSKDVFNNNFFKDWRKMMTDKERSKITDLKKCNFKPMNAYFLDLSEKNRNRTKEEREELKKKNAELLEEYGFCTIDGHREKIGNFKIEPPGLFRGRGEHPKMGMLKRRVMPEDVSINCSKDSKFPTPPAGHKWKDVRHDPSVTWLASWTENVQNQVKYVMLNPSSKLKGEKDWQKYETARRLAKSIDKIRREYREDWKSKEMRIRQRAVALYFIDKLALRAGNEKDEDQADTVGCCSLRVEHISLHEHKDGKDYVVVFDFLGKDSIRYYNEVPVEKRVFKNLQLFMENKSGSDDLFDRLNTAVMNKHLNELMEGLTAKVFRTYNASWTLQQQLDQLTNEDDSVAEKILSYNRANRAVAILCNHQRSVPKGHAKSMEKLKEKIDQKKEQIAEAERQVKDAKRSAKHGSVKEQVLYDKKKKMLEKMKEQLKKLEVQETDRDENKTIALGTSKLNYLDPRISVAWCKKYEVPIEKIYNKTQRDKFRWAIDMADADYVF